MQKNDQILKNYSASVNKENFYRRIIPADSADEFYCIMGQLSQEMLEYKIEDTNRLIKVHNWYSEKILVMNKVIGNDY